MNNNWKLCSRILQNQRLSKQKKSCKRQNARLDTSETQSQERIVFFKAVDAQLIKDTGKLQSGRAGRSMDAMLLITGVSTIMLPIRPRNGTTMG